MNLFRKLFTTRGLGVKIPEAALVTSPREERRTTGKLVEDLVECAVEMRELEGTDEARAFLRFASVPPSVMRRVLSSSAQFRKTRAQ